VITAGKSSCDIQQPMRRPVIPDAAKIDRGIFLSEKMAVCGGHSVHILTWNRGIGFFVTLRLTTYLHSYNALQQSGQAMLQSIKRFIRPCAIGLAMILAGLWLYDRREYEPAIILLLWIGGFGSLGVHEKRSVQQRKLEQEHPERFALVQRRFLRSHVNTETATQNQLLLILLSRYPRWTSKWYLERSLRDRNQTQPFEESVRELRQGGRIIERWPFFIKLSGSGLHLAEDRAENHVLDPM